MTMTSFPAIKEDQMKVLACIDSSDYAVSVCDHAAWAANQLSLPVEVLHVLERAPFDPAIAPDRSGRLGVDTREALLAQLVALDEHRNRLEQENGRLVLDEAAAEVRRGGVATVTQRLAHGEPVDIVHEYEEDARLVVLGKRGEGAEHAESHLGSNLERVIRASTRPVIVASKHFEPIERYLIAYDGGQSSNRAIDFLVDEPLLEGAEGHILLIGTGTSTERQRLTDAAARLRGAGYTITEHLEHGDPEELIPKIIASEDIDMLVMGAYGHSRIRSLLIGSTTTTLLRTSTVPVLVVR